MLSLRTTNRDVLKLVSLAFPEGEFEAPTLSWDEKGLKMDGVSPSSDLLAHLEMPRGAFASYQSDTDGKICLFTKTLSPLLSQILGSGDPTAAMTATFQFEDQRTLKLEVLVQGWGRRMDTLRHISDKMIFQRPVVRFEPVATLAGSPHDIVRSALATMTPAKDIGLSWANGEVVFSDAANPESRFLPQKANAEGGATAIFIAASLDYATKVSERLTPQWASLSINARGLARLIYEFGPGSLEYFITPIMGSE